MSLNGIRPPLAGLTTPPSLTRPDATPSGEAHRGHGRIAPHPSARPTAPAAPNVVVRTTGAQATGVALSAEAPPGTDPELWSILTSEERQFFTQLGARGPLTYGYLARAQSLPATAAAYSRGGRLDVKG